MNTNGKITPTLINCYGSLVNVVPYYSYYRDPYRLAIILYDVDTDEEYAIITVNLVDSPIYGENQSYVDINNCPWAIDYIRRSGIGKPVGEFGSSGFCVYPLFEFDLERMIELHE